MSPAGRLRERWGRATRKQRRRAIELAIGLAVIGVIAAEYGALAPQVIIVLSWWLSLFVVLVQLPFLVGLFGIRRFRPAQVAALLALPFLIAFGYRSLYKRDLFRIWYGEWLGTLPLPRGMLVIAALFALSFLVGLLGRRMRHR